MDPAKTASAVNLASWLPLRALSGWSVKDLNGDLAAGITLAAIAIPEQMATARLGGFAPEIGFFAFVAGSVAFAVLGANRHLSAGADSTITPLFAGGLALIATGAAGDAQRHFPPRLDRRSPVRARHDRFPRRHFGSHHRLPTAWTIWPAAAER
jgi:MFS superfamily sulfate permease-like transporter